MTNSLNELSDVYLSQVAEQEGSDNTPENVKVRVLQIVKAIRYKAKKEGGNLVKAFNDYMGGQSGIGAAERHMVKQRLGLSEEVGITSTEKMQKALKDAQLKKKEDEAVAKAKNIKKEEVVNEIIDPKGARRQDAAKPKKETPLTPEQKAKRDKANKLIDKEYYRPNPKEYPTMWKKRVDEAKVDTGSAEEKATARNKRNTPPGANRKFDTSVFITRKPGESLDSARTRKRRDAHAAKRGGSHNRSSSQGQMMSGKSTIYREDKAFDNVVSMLRKKHGESSVITKDSPKPKAQPRPKAKPQKPLTAKEKAQREVDAQYGRTPWNKKGSLGT